MVPHEQIRAHRWLNLTPAGGNVGASLWMMDALLWLLTHRACGAVVAFATHRLAGNLLSIISMLAVIMAITFPSPAQAVVLKIATLSPDGSIWMTKFRGGAEQVAEDTDNRVRFKFYPGG